MSTRTEQEIEREMIRVRKFASKEGCTPAAFKRISKKLEDLWHDIGTIAFDDIDMLCMFMNERRSYNLYWTMLRLAYENKIMIIKKDDGFYYLDWIPF